MSEREREREREREKEREIEREKEREIEREREGERKRGRESVFYELSTEGSGEYLLPPWHRLPKSGKKTRITYSLAR